MFIENEYYTEYKRIISRVIEVGGEVHHILPKSGGGTDDDDNLVRLSAGDHFRAHVLLPFFTEGPLKTSMLHAWNMMSGTRYYNTDYKEYERLKEARKIALQNQVITPEFRAKMSILTTGDKNGMYGKEHKDSSLKIMKEKKAGENNPMYGKENKAKSGTCPHCNKTMDIRNLSRHHLDNCKHKV